MGTLEGIAFPRTKQFVVLVLNMGPLLYSWDLGTGGAHTGVEGPKGYLSSEGYMNLHFNSLWEAAWQGLSRTNRAQVDTSRNYPLSDKDCWKLRMPDRGTRRQRDEPTTEEVTQKPRELKSLLKCLFQKKKNPMFPNGTQRESWAATEVSNLADVRAGLSTASLEDRGSPRSHACRWRHSSGSSLQVFRFLNSL